MADSMYQHFISQVCLFHSCSSLTLHLLATPPLLSSLLVTSHIHLPCLLTTEPACDLRVQVTCVLLACCVRVACVLRACCVRSHADHAQVTQDHTICMFQSPHHSTHSLSQATTTVKQAISEDTAGNSGVAIGLYVSSTVLYMKALECMFIERGEGVRFNIKYSININIFFVSCRR